VKKDVCESALGFVLRNILLFRKDQHKIKNPSAAQQKMRWTGKN
jgi:hypothetical protein